MLIDPEIEAISKSYDVLKDLDDNSKKRVIQWLVSKFNLADEFYSSKVHFKKNEEPKVLTHKANNEEQEEIEAEVVGSTNEEEIEYYSSVADFFAKINPSSGSKKALTIATYLQVTKNLPDITGYEINKELKHLGHASKNITVDIKNLIQTKPQLMIQTRKDGTSQQAKKKYKVTDAGLKHIKEILSNES
ncbi:MAG: hypothetical protein K9G70_14160 [Prolixibacteraceae bacterium]|nr:hypothetical protein [Prolixibacteraceae bacterium]